VGRVSVDMLWCVVCRPVRSVCCLWCWACAPGCWQFPQHREHPGRGTMAPSGLEPQTLWLLATRSRHLSYATLVAPVCQPGRESKAATHDTTRAGPEGSGDDDPPPPMFASRGGAAKQQPMTPRARGLRAAATVEQLLCKNLGGVGEHPFGATRCCVDILKIAPEVLIV